MRSICSYCRADLGERDPLEDERVTHGMCDDCARYFERRWGAADLGEYLDTFDVPVLVVESSGRAVGANEQLARALGKSGSEIRGRLGGEVMECAFSRQPAGCGKTSHCGTCLVRITVEQTFRSGRAQEHVAVTLQRDSGTAAFVISTRKHGDVVLLELE